MHTNRAWYKNQNRPVNRAARRNIARVLAFVEGVEARQKDAERLAKRRERDRARRVAKAA